MTLKVAIVGPGTVGASLGSALLKRPKDFEIKYGARHPSKHGDVLREQPGVDILPVHDAVDWADAVIFAVPTGAADASIVKATQTLGPGVEGKVLLHATNPFDKNLAWRWSQGTSAGEVIAAALPHTHVYKAFNTVGWEHMRAADGSRLGSPSLPLTMLVAGVEQSDARAVAEAVVAGVGFSPRYVGPIRYARNLEAMAELWVHVGGGWGRNFHFQVVGKT